ncbi:28S ribosomal protein S27, mitochondrial [Eumeta japonica]|uniref:28S ribosomal protein S27, mitochondrial n=1 Tax=Eumeta variegata TaxID=151549 RepID=A0A4C1X6W8_EUMVA|nr:28S ribosomal protein S27, mitochondrial [Eumeta japonica]
MDLLHKLRMSADTCNTLDSTHHATIRNFLEFGNINELLVILKDPLNYGIFLDTFTSNLLLDKLLTDQEFEKAALVASLVMLQEDYSNDITCTLSQYACYKYILGYECPTEKSVEENVKVEEVKVRVKYLRNPYFDDHFDIRDPYLLAGKSLAWISERENDNVNLQLQLIGWLAYQKYDKLLSLSKKISESTSSLLYPEVLQLMQKEISKQEISKDNKNILENSFSVLDKVNKSDVTLEEPIKIHIENAINKVQKNDITAQSKLFKSWIEIREMKLKEQIDRLDRAKRVQILEEKQKKLSEEEQKLWFFENEEKIDLTIEQKEHKNIQDTGKNKKKSQKDEDYVPPEIRSTSSVFEKLQFSTERGSGPCSLGKANYQRNKRTMYKMCIRTMMTYASPVFAHAAPKALDRLQVI